jgi:hypothetical protein
MGPSKAGFPGASATPAPAAPQAAPALGVAGATRSAVGRDAASSSLSRIAAAPASPIKGAALAQAQLIVADSSACGARIRAIGASRRQQLHAYVASQRQDVASFFASTATRVEAAGQEARAHIAEVAQSILESAHANIATALAMADAAAAGIRAGIDAMAAAITASVQSSVDAAADRIVALVDSVHLPDFLRGPIVDLLRGAASLVTGGLSLVIRVVQGALDTGVSLITSVLGLLGQATEELLAVVVAAVESILNTVARLLTVFVDHVVRVVDTVVMGALEPGLNLAEALVAQVLEQAERTAIEQVDDNRNRHLEALAASLAAAPTSNSPTVKARSLDESIAAIRAIGVEAVRIDHDIVQTFEDATSGSLAAIVQSVAGTIGRAIGLLRARVEAALVAVAGVVARVLEGVAMMARAVAESLRSLIGWVARELTGALNFVQRLMQDPADALKEFASHALRRLSSFVAAVVSALVGVAHDIIGVFVLPPGPLYRPSPPPTKPPTIIEIIVTVVIVVLSMIFGPEVAVIVFWVLVILLIILVLYLLYLLLKWLFKPRPPLPPPPPPTPRPPLAIFGPDPLWYFDGQTPPVYVVAATYRSNRTGGAYAWTTSPHLTLSSPVVPTPVATTAAPSSVLGDAWINLVYTPPSGAAETARLNLTVRAPTSVTFINNVDSPDPTWGYNTQIHYDIVDQFVVVLPNNVPINENWTGPVVPDTPGMNWRRGSPGPATVAPVNWMDFIQGETAGHVPAPVAPGTPGAGTAVYHWPGEWRVGTLTIGSGRRVSSAHWAGSPTVIWQKYRGFARHT